MRSIRSSRLSALPMATVSFALLASTFPAVAQKSGGTLKGGSTANPPSLSIHEEITISTVQKIMPVFSNLVMFDPQNKTNSPASIIPELAETWSWSPDSTRLTFKLRSGVRWHDGKPFTSKDVKCTWDRLTDREPGYFRKNPRRIWYKNLQEVTTDGDLSVTFHLGRPQPSLITMLASGMSPVYPCHVSSKYMRTNPIGTGPFKLVEFKSNQYVRLERNPDYWKKGLPHLDAIEMRILPNRSTRTLALIAGEIDITSPGDITVPILKDVNRAAPHIQCTLGPTNTFPNVLINSTRPPFDNPLLRRAAMLGLDRQGFIDIMSQGAASISGVMQALPEGLWGMPKEVLEQLPGYSGTLVERQAEAYRIMASLGFGPTNRLKIKVSTRDFSSYKEAAVILVDQLNKLHFDAELEIVESAIWFGRAARQEFTIAYNISGAGIDDPDVTLTENFACNSENNFTRYCNADVDRLLEKQSAERDAEKRKRIVWQIEALLAEQIARPVLWHGRAAQCWHPHVKGYVRQENSIYNQWRLEGLWLDRSTN